MIKFLLPFLTMFSPSSYGMITSLESQISNCDLNLPRTIVYGNNSEKNLEQKLKEKSNCNINKIKIVTSTLLSITGKIPSSYLKNIFITKGINLITKYNFIELSTLESKIINEIQNLKKIKVQKIKHAFKTDIILTNSEFDIIIDFDNNTAEIKTNIENQFLTDTSFIDYQEEKIVYVSKKQLYPYSSQLSSTANIEKEKRYVWSKELRDLVDPALNLSGYEISKIIPINSPLRKTDIKLKTIINSGNIITVIHNIGGLTIRSFGTSRTSGKIGEKIEVKLSNNKIVTGIIQSGEEIYVKI